MQDIYLSRSFSTLLHLYFKLSKLPKYFLLYLSCVSQYVITHPVLFASMWAGHLYVHDTINSITLPQIIIFYRLIILFV